MSERRRTVRRKNIVNFNIGIVIFAIIIIYVLFNIFSYITKSHIAEYQVQQGTIASNYIYQGIIVRDETVEYAPRDGFVNYYVKNASKVSVTDIIYSIDTNGSIAEKIATSGTDTGSISSETLNSISTEIATFVSDYNSNQFSEAYTFYQNLNTQIVQDVNLNALTNLSSQVASAESNKTFYQITSPEDGVVAYEIDGFEDHTIEDIVTSEINYNSYSEQHLFANNEVKSGDPVYKRVNSEYWNVIVPIDETLAKALNEKSAIRVRFCKDNFELDTACSLIKEKDHYFLNLSLNKGMVRYINDRFVDVELIMGDKIGLKIPNSAITTKEFFTIPKSFFTIGGDSEKPAVLIKRVNDDSEESKMIYPTVYYETDEFYYLDNEDVSENDIIMLIGNTSVNYVVGTDKAPLTGVYNINKGYAVFKQINIIYQNESYSIVETKTDYGISLYDHIALDASKVKENQLTTE